MESCSCCVFQSVWSLACDAALCQVWLFQWSHAVVCVFQPVWSLAFDAVLSQVWFFSMEPCSCLCVSACLTWSMWCCTMDRTCPTGGSLSSLVEHTVRNLSLHGCCCQHADRSSVLFTWFQMFVLSSERFTLPTKQSSILSMHRVFHLS